MNIEKCIIQQQKLSKFVQRQIFNKYIKIVSIQIRIKLLKEHQQIEMNKMVNQFLKPAKITYRQHDLGLRKFLIRDQIIQRQQMVINDVPFSFYCYEQKECIIKQQRSVVIYIHSFNSNKMQVRGILNPILQFGFNVIAIQLQRVYIDQSKQPKLDNQLGSISFGFYEYQQIKHVVKWVKIRNPRSKIILWGRSMGAVCAIKYQAIYQGADKIVLDSPFHDLEQVFMVKAKQFFSIPHILTKGLLNIFSTQITHHCNFQIKQLKMLPYMNFTTPTVFICNKLDSLAGKSTDLLYKQCTGPKQLIYTDSGHSQERQKIVIQDTLKFLSQQKRMAKIRKMVRSRSQFKRIEKHMYSRNKCHDQTYRQNASTQRQEQISQQDTVKSNRRKQFINFEKDHDAMGLNRPSNYMCFF